LQAARIAAAKTTPAATNPLRSDWAGRGHLRSHATWHYRTFAIAFGCLLRQQPAPNVQRKDILNGDM
jgi:hypothetical protein